MANEPNGSKKKVDSRLLTATLTRPTPLPNAKVAPITTRKNNRKGSPGTSRSRGIWNRNTTTSTAATTASRTHNGQRCVCKIFHVIVTGPLDFFACYPIASIAHLGLGRASIGARMRPFPNTHCRRWLTASQNREPFLRLVARYTYD